jgi:transposase
MKPLTSQMFELWKQGNTQRQIAKQFGLSVATVGKYLRAHPSWKDPRKKLTPSRVAVIMEMYKDGSSVACIARSIHAGRRHVLRVLKQAGVSIRPDAWYTKGERNSAWVNGRVVRKGYVYVHCPQHPFATKSGYVLEHRLVMENVLGRHLKRKEVVHHINGNRQDNRRENLKLFSSNGAHLAEELAGRCPNWTEDGKRRLAESRRRLPKVK